MADAPSETSLNPSQSRGGLFQKGGPGGPGRKALPEAFTSLEPLALAQLAAMATGVVLEELIPPWLSDDEHAAALSSLQASAANDDKRLEAACRMTDRVRGRPKESVEHTGEVTQTAIIEVRFKDPPQQKPVIDVEPQAKALK